MTFLSREDAGQRLGGFLAEREVSVDLVLGLPRGGVVVAAEVADCLRVPLSALLVRKIGHPAFPEFALGALAEGNVLVLDSSEMSRTGLETGDLERVISEEIRRLEEERCLFTPGPRLDLHGRRVAIIDDGLATGSTLEAALQSVRKQGITGLIAAVPVASRGGARRVTPHCDEFYALTVDPNFQAVGQYYDYFGQIRDAQVVEILNRFRSEHR